MSIINNLFIDALCLFILVQAQGIAFTRVPASVAIGKPVTLKWNGGDASAATIVLKSGPAEALRTVDVITGEATGGSYTWTPAANLPTGDDYAFQISQGVSDVNYSGHFTIYDQGPEEILDLIASTTVTSTTVTSTTIASATVASTTVTSKTVTSTTSASAAFITSESSASVLSLISSFLSAIASASNARSTTAVFITSPRSVTTTDVIATADSAASSITPIPPKTTNTKIALTASIPVGVVVLIISGFFVYRCRRKRKEIEKENVINPMELAELSGHQEHELSTNARNLRPELSG